jgi:hypothetical protein
MHINFLKQCYKKTFYPPFLKCNFCKDWIISNKQKLFFLLFIYVRSYLEKTHLLKKKKNQNCQNRHRGCLSNTPLNKKQPLEKILPAKQGLKL